MESELYTVVDENNNEARKEAYPGSAEFNSSLGLGDNNMVFEKEEFENKVEIKLERFESKKNEGKGAELIKEVVFQDSELFDNGDSKENVSKKENKNFDTCDTHKENGKYSVTGQDEGTSGDCIHTEVKGVLSKKQQNSELDFEKLVTAYVTSIKVKYS